MQFNLYSYLNPFAISGLLIAFTCLALFVFIIICGKTKTTKLYALHALSVGIWGAGVFLIGINKNYDLVINIWKCTYIGVLFIPVFLLHAIFLLSSYQNKKLLIFSYLQAIFFLILTINGKIITHLRFMFDSFYYGQGTGWHIVAFLIWIALVAFEHFILLKFYLRTQDIQRKRILFLSISTILGFIGGAANFLPAFGLNIYPYGNFLIPFYCVIMAYAIFKYKALDINIVIRKGLVYSILIALITAIYLTFVLLIERLFRGFVGYQSIIISLIAAFMIVIVFNPLKNKIQSLIDFLFLKKTPQQIERENELLRQELERSERLKAVATFASGIAHEVKNPLTAVKTFSEYLPKKLDDKEFLKKFSKIVGSEVSRIDDLVHQLLDFAKPAPLKIQTVNIHNLLDDTLNFLNNEFIKHRIKLIKEYSAISNELRADSNKLKQAFLNLFLNAIEAMPKGGNLNIKTDNQKPNSIEITIQDSGIGIKSKDLPHLFDPFFSTKESGAGLGLSITHGIIKEHGGKISVESKLGKGTKFVLELPISRV